MVTASVNKKQMGRSLFAALLAVGLIAGGIAGMKRWQQKKQQQPAAIPGSTTEQREAYLARFGYQLDSQSTVTEVAVPQEFDSRFTEYNEMLKTLGFDLEPYKGKVVLKCSYTVTAGAPRSGNLTAVLLVHEGRIVGGHLLDEALQRIYPLYDTAQHDSTQTLIGAETVIAETFAPQPQPESALLPTAGDGAWPTD